MRYSFPYFERLSLILMLHHCHHTGWEVRAGPNPEYRSMISMRTMQEHVGRRKRWNRAFSTISVKEYEPIVIKRALQLADELQRRSSKGDHTQAESFVNLAQWLSFFACVFSYMISPSNPVSRNQTSSMAGLTSWAIWRELLLVFSVNSGFNLFCFHRFGGGFELMRDGQDKIGVWTIIEESSEHVSLSSSELVHVYSSTC